MKLSLTCETFMWKDQLVLCSCQISMCLMLFRHSNSTSTLPINSANIHVEGSTCSLFLPNIHVSNVVPTFKFNFHIANQLSKHSCGRINLFFVPAKYPCV